MALSRGMPTRTALVCALLVYAATSLPPAPAEQRSGQEHVIVIDKFSFQPDTLAVSVGETVEWRNKDIVPHTATSLDGQTFNSGRIQAGGSWRVTLRKPGGFEYVCTLHPNMKGKLLVR